MINAGNYEVQVIRSRRKTLSVSIRDGALVVSAPLRTSDQTINDFLYKHRRWIQVHMEKAQASHMEAESAGRLTMEEIRDLADQALKVIPERVKHYAALMGVTYGRITIRNQRTRWGSCTAQGNLNFNCLLMLCPLEVIDSVIVHELAHRREMNHSPRFYALVRKAYPEYDKWNQWLKDNGPVLMKRMTG